MKKRWMILGLVFFAFYASTGSAFAFLLPHLRNTPLNLYTRLNIEPDGSVLVSEKIHLSASIKDREFSFYVPLANDQAINASLKKNLLKDFITEATDNIQYIPVSESAHSITQENNKLSIWLSVPSSESDAEYLLTYYLPHAVINHFDTAQFQLHRLQPMESFSVETWTVSVNLPFEGETKKIMAWMRSSGFGSLLFNANAIEQAITKAVSSSRSYVHILFPTTQTPDNPNQSMEFALSSIIRKEKLQVNNYALFLSFLLLLLVFGYIFFQWKKNIRTTSFLPEKLTINSLPTSYRGAEVGLIYRLGKLHSRDLVATLIQLATEGYLHIEEYILFVKKNSQTAHTLDYRLTLEDKPWDNLNSYEKILLKTFFSDFSGNEKSIALHQISKILSKQPCRFTDFWKRWTDNLKKRNIVLRFFDLKKRRKQIFFIAFGITLILWSATICFFINLSLDDWGYLWPVGSSLFISGLSFIIFSFFFKKRSAQTQNEYFKLQAYQKYLSELPKLYSPTSHPSLNHFNQALPFVVIYEIEESFLRNLQNLYANADENDIFASNFYHSSLSEEISKNIFSNIEHMIHKFTAIFSSGSKQVQKIIKKNECLP